VQESEIDPELKKGDPVWDKKVSNAPVSAMPLGDEYVVDVFCPELACQLLVGHFLQCCALLLGQFSMLSSSLFVVIDIEPKIRFD